MPTWSAADLVTALALLTAVLAVIKGFADLRSHAEYRVAKDAQLAALNESVRTKDATIEMLKAISYAEAAKHLSGQREVYESRIAELNMALEQASKNALTLPERAAGALPEPAPEISLSAQLAGGAHVSATLSPGESMTATEMALLALALEMIGTAGYFDGQGHYVLNNGDRLDVGPSESADFLPVRDPLTAILKHNSKVGPFSIAVVVDQIEAAEKKWQRIHPERPNPLS